MAMIDWTHGESHMFAEHKITVEWANEALADPSAVIFDPDYNTKSGISVRTIGYSSSFGDLLSVITVTENGITYGVNGWKSNPRDRRYYNQESE